MKKSMKIAVAALVAFVILGTWAVGFAIAEADKTSSAEASSAVVQAQTLSSGTALASGTVAAGTPIYDQSELFTDRDLQQTADLTEAVTYAVADGQDITITEAGVYVLTGQAEGVTVYVAADKEDKVQLVLDGLAITNGDAPAIYVKSADKVFVTVADDSSLSVTGAFDESDKADGVIFSKSDLTLNGTAALTISSTENGVVGKDDLKIAGGTYVISAKVKAIEANDSIRIADGVFELTAGTDGLHAENDDDDTTGYIYLGGGTCTIQAGDDGRHATAVIQVDGGQLTIAAAEGIEATYVQLNGGTIAISSWDDGINAAQKSKAYRATVEINGGDITIAMGAGDTDGVDSNGDILVNGGTVSVTGNSTFDYNGTGTITGGTVIVNGQQVTTLPNQMMGGRGGFGGGWGGNGGFGGPGGRRGW